jgi:hypothetical protein
LTQGRRRFGSRRCTGANADQSEFSRRRIQGVGIAARNDDDGSCLLEALGGGETNTAVAPVISAIFPAYRFIFVPPVVE